MPPESVLGAPPESGPAGAAEPAPLAILDFLLSIAAQVGWIFLPMLLLWLLLRRLVRSALVVAVLGIGTGVLSLGLEDAVRWGASSTSAVQTSQLVTPNVSILVTSVTLGALLLVFLPAVPRGGRGWALASGSLFLAAGVAAVVLREQQPAAALQGAILGLGWVAVTALAQRRWNRRDAPATDSGTVGSTFQEPAPLRPAPLRHARLQPAPVRAAVFVRGRRGAAVLAVAAGLLAAGLIAAGLLITRVLASVREFDASVIEWFVTIRTPVFTELAHALGPWGNTPGIIMMLILAATMTSALTQRWAPVLFMLAATAGETAIFLLVQGVVGRARPSVEHLVGLPGTHSFPSGHVAASVATYGAIALLLRAWAGRRVGRIAFLLAALLAIGVALSRLYVGVHYPTDVVFSFIFASCWLWACWVAFQPHRGSPLEDAERSLRSGRSRQSGPSMPAETPW